MEQTLKSYVLGWLVAMIFLAPLHAQTVASETSAAPANPAPAGHAPDDVMKELSDLVHAGKYVEAQGLTAGLLLAYPTDQRLLKAKTLLYKNIASLKPEYPSGSGNPPVRDVASSQLAGNTNAEQLTGMNT